MKRKPIGELRKQMTPEQLAESQTRAQLASLSLTLAELYHVRWNTYAIGGDKAEGRRQKAEGRRQKVRKKVARQKGIMTV